MINYYYYYSTGFCHICRFKNLFIIWSVQENQTVELLCKSKTFALATHQIKIYALLEFPKKRTYFYPHFIARLQNLKIKIKINLERN